MNPSMTTHTLDSHHGPATLAHERNFTKCTLYYASSYGLALPPELVLVSPNSLLREPGTSNSRKFRLLEVTATLVRGAYPSLRSASPAQRPTKASPVLAELCPRLGFDEDLRICAAPVECELGW